MKWTSIGITLGLCALSVFAQIPDASKLKCRLCNNANGLIDCSTLTICDNRTEECYTDQVITPTFEIVYRSGCRARQQCEGSSAQVGKRQTDGELIACSRCCAKDADCNERLCGLQATLVNIDQCYFCDSAHSDQGDVTDPEDCITMTTCDVDQACFGQNKYHPGQPTSFRYGCFNFEICRVMMKTAFDDLARCENGGDNCGTDNSGVCNVCCRGGGCNYGDCHVIRKQLYDQYKNNGVFNLDTLESTSGGTNTTASPAGK